VEARHAAPVLGYDPLPHSAFRIPLAPPSSGVASSHRQASSASMPITIVSKQVFAARGRVCCPPPGPVPPIPPPPPWRWDRPPLAAAPPTLL